ncbi:MAG: FGGY-family carbohydrate kinase, partial [Eubacteriales bacterium]|nr:FGGY-family carbohydrate kinase [Eubacteriales bacterium]
RGGFFGLSAMHGRGDLARAVMEGISYSLKDCFDILDGMVARPESMLLTGGGARSPFWRQMLSDVFGCPATTIQSSEGPALGVAILAGVGAGMYESVEKACGQMIATGEKLLPDPESHKAYAAYHGLYQKLYPALKDSFQVLKEL